MSAARLPSVRVPAAVARNSGVAAVLTATVFWSFGGVLAKSTGAEGIVVTFWRMWVASLVLVGICGARRVWPTWAELRRSALAGVLFGLNLALFFTALERLTVANALVIAALAPVLMLPIAARTLGERITPVKLVCAGLAVAGVVAAVLTTPDGESKRTDTGFGSLLAVAGLLVWLGYLVESKRVRRTVDTLPFMLGMSVVGAVAVSVFVAAQRTHLGTIHGEGWVWIVALAVGPGIAGHGLVAWAQQRVDASVSTVLMQAEPVGATIAAYFLLDERVSWAQAGAMTVVVAALALLAYRETREAAAPVLPGPAPWLAVPPGD